MEECLDDDPAVRPNIANVCERIQVSKDTYVKECPQDVITLHQRVQELRVENEKLTKSNEEMAATLQYQMVLNTLQIVSIALCSIVSLVLYKEYTNTTRSQST